MTTRRSARWTTSAGAAWASPGTSGTATDPHTAEIAVTVIDDWQGRGLGTELLARLSERACQEGISRFTAAVAADNAAMAGLLRSFGGDLMRREFGTLEYEMALACAPARRARSRGNAPGRDALS